MNVHKSTVIKKHESRTKKKIKFWAQNNYFKKKFQRSLCNPVEPNLLLGEGSKTSLLGSLILRADLVQQTERLRDEI